jgi:deazaflavin-dependent oxidoreductase (nitroreductase family)
MQFLYLTTIGRKSGRPREIEIWFTEREGKYYVIAEHRDRAQWVRNLLVNPAVDVRVGDRAGAGHARVVSDETERDLAADIRRRSEAKYGWGDGLIVELTLDV